MTSSFQCHWFKPSVWRASFGPVFPLFVCLFIVLFSWFSVGICLQDGYAWSYHWSWPADVLETGSGSFPGGLDLTSSTRDLLSQPNTNAEFTGRRIVTTIMSAAKSRFVPDYRYFVSLVCLKTCNGIKSAMMTDVCCIIWTQVVPFHLARVFFSNLTLAVYELTESGGWLTEFLSLSSFYVLPFLCLTERLTICVRLIVICRASLALPCF